MTRWCLCSTHARAMDPRGRPLAHCDGRVLDRDSRLGRVLGWTPAEAPLNLPRGPGSQLRASRRDLDTALPRKHRRHLHGGLPRGESMQWTNGLPLLRAPCLPPTSWH